jgi:RHS repeat-associated protein
MVTHSGPKPGSSEDAMLKRYLTAALIALLPAGVSAQVVEYYHLDLIGNVRAVTSQTGAEVERHDYLPFGEEWNPQPGNQPKRFTGKERDAETGLDYFGARYYGPKIGRFTTIDPVYTWRENLADPQRWNRYAYGIGNPLRYIDPDGRHPALAQLFQRIANSPAGQRIGQFVSTQAANLKMAAMRLVNSPSAQEAVQVAAEIATGADIPGGIPGNLPFKSGDIITREFKTAKGMVDLAAEAVVEGKQLHLKDIAVFPRGAKLEVGSGEVFAMRQQLADEARALGFDQLRITGTRLSGAKPGKAVDVTIDLKEP